ncbi:PIG-L deacetylase family protein [Paenibacillus sp. MBLB4367]|uniref:PIG-L deacetylase family protein n=1 Tax=Paenibacillus sp. MBLB4367 TaxID=3384767 RepID=UPI003907E841
MFISGQERIVIFAPHADDEVLGCGGLIEMACRMNNRVKVILAAVGTLKFHHAEEKITANTRKKELAAALNVLGCNDYEVMYDDKESFLDTIPQNELVTKIDRILSTFCPTMVLVPYPSFHQDHQALFKACMAGLRPSPNRQIKLIAMYEYPFIVWQYPKIHDAGELYLDISDTIDKKVAAFQQHVSQVREDASLISPHNVKRWAEMRGMEIGVRYAEKYHLMRATLA